jgi:hypothetical protein
LTGTSNINIGSNILSSGTQNVNINRPLTCGSVNSGAINANANLIETTGSLQYRGLLKKNVSDSESASISSTGSLISKSLQSKMLTIKDASNNDIAIISNVY